MFRMIPLSAEWINKAVVSQTLVLRFVDACYVGNCFEKESAGVSFLWQTCLVMCLSAGKEA